MSPWSTNELHVFKYTHQLLIFVASMDTLWVMALLVRSRKGTMVFSARRDLRGTYCLGTRRGTCHIWIDDDFHRGLMMNYFHMISIEDLWIDDDFHMIFIIMTDERWYDESRLFFSLQTDRGHSSNSSNFLVPSELWKMMMFSEKCANMSSIWNDDLISLGRKR